MRTILTITAAAALLAVGAQSAQAHTRSFGFIPQTNGDVTFYIGTYDHGGTTPVTGSLTIDGTPYAFTTSYTNTTTTALGLTGGSTAPGTFFTTSPGWSAPSQVDFQSVTVSGLSSGSYTFGLTGTSGAHFDGSGPLPITTSVTVNSTAVPEPSSLALLGMGVAGLAAARRRRRKTSDEADNEA
ncbi:PEP-CTERM motif protein [Maioricimonas rarisocia]|uniref:PEP-CTERM motif protein n=1 Tax=Maioricimonas rarisocia TaxID=2528026 RepID=A0A517Z321_9PLAN|nr:PEP-CTERM sorting domain-containing protein [Maioricimonas rarisocia]QDU36817.1 PEP-CTERM motif protein [Maioricimonas rarisocia]